MVKLVGVYFQRHRVKDAESMMQKAFDSGQQLFKDERKAHPESQAYTFDSFNALGELAQLVAERAPEPVAELERIRGVQNDILRTRMLVFLARGWRQQLSTSG